MLGLLQLEGGFMLCDECNEKEASGSRQLSFVYRGVNAHILRDELQCAKCAVNFATKRLNGFLGNLFCIEDGEVVVSWKFYSQLAEGKREDASLALMDVSVLSFNDGNNWEIIADTEIVLNPRLMTACLYFKRKEEAINYARMQFSQTQYGWRIRRIGEVVTRRTALETK